MNFLKRCWQKRWIRGLAWTAVTLVTLYVLLCTWLNWSWGRQWNATVAMLKTEGETLDFRATMNDPIPEAENFCAIPLLKDIALVLDDNMEKGEPAEKRKHLASLKLPSREKGDVRPGLPNATLGSPTNLKAWADWLRKDGSLRMPPASGDAARDVMAALSQHDAIVQELASGLHRPGAQWTPEWKTREMPENLFSVAVPHYASLMSANQTMALRATAASRAGDTRAAHESVQIMACLNQATLNEPFLIGLLVGASKSQMMAAATWEICDAQAGTVEGFTRLEAALALLDFHRSALRAFRSEMSAAVNTMQYLKRHPSNAPELFQVAKTLEDPGVIAPGNIAIRVIPLGFFDASAAVLADSEFKYLIKPLRDHGWKEAREAALAWDEELKQQRNQMWMRPTHIVTLLIAPSISKIIHKIIHTQALVNQSVIACALERLRIEKGSYPDSLDAVKLADGRPLPGDPMNGNAMGYRKTTDGRYALWSVGFDGKDDGGKRVLDEKRRENTKFSDAAYVGDWVWDFPSKK